MIRRPQSIKKGSTIGVTAPSYGAATEPYSLRYPIAKTKIEDRGYRILEGETVFKGDGLGISTDPVTTARELMKFYESDECDAIISAGGGELMNETITGVDFNRLKNCRPKWFMGYSDNTNFIFPMVTIAGVQGIYGPCFGGFAKEWERTEFDSFALLEGTKSVFEGINKFVDPTLPMSMPENKVGGVHVYTDKELMAPYDLNANRHLKYFGCEDEHVRMDGLLLGGCLDILANLVGTRFDRVKDFKRENQRIIWVFEACDLSPMSIRRSLWNLREAGWLKDAAGFIIGRPYASWKQNMLGVDQYNAVTDVLSGIGAPMLMDVEIGHVEPMLPVIIGAEAVIEAAEDTLLISYT